MFSSAGLSALPSPRTCMKKAYTSGKYFCSYLVNLVRELGKALACRPSSSGIRALKLEDVRYLRNSRNHQILGGVIWGLVGLSVGLCVWACLKRPSPLRHQKVTIPRQVVPAPSPPPIPPSPPEFIQKRSSSTLSVEAFKDAYKQAIEEEDLTPLKALLEAGHLPSQYPRGYTPLHLAAIHGDLVLVRTALQRGVPIDSKTDSSGFTALHLAAQNDQGPVVDLLLQQGAEIETETKDGLTPLHLASYEGALDAVRTLVARGAAVGAESPTGTTPLHVAASKGWDDVVSFLRKHGAALDPVDGEGRTPLFLAVRRAESEVVDLLLKQGASLDVVVEGRNLLHEACRKNLPGMARFLLTKGFDVNVPSEEDDEGEFEGWTPLHWAAYANSDEIVEILVHHESRVEARTPVDGTLGGQTPLHVAALNGCTRAVDALAEAGAHVNAVSDTGDPSKGGLTPLQLAVMEGHYKTARTLVMRDAELNLVKGQEATAYGSMSPLYLAVQRGDKKLAEYLRCQGANPNVKPLPNIASPMELANVKGGGTLKRVLKGHRTKGVKFAD